MKGSKQMGLKDKAMESTGIIIYTLWTVTGDVKLKVHYGIHEGEGHLNLGFIEISVIDPQPDASITSKIDEEMEDIISTCVQDYEIRKKDRKSVTLDKDLLFNPDNRPKLYRKAHANYDFSIN
jgi:hypothetical protein